MKNFIKIYRSFKRNFQLCERTPLSISCTALIFGSLFCAFFYISFGALSHFIPLFLIIGIPFLLIGVGFLFFVFIAESNIERSLRKRFEGVFQPVFNPLIALSFITVYFILGRIENFSRLTFLEYWFYLFCFLSLSTLVAFIIILFSPRTRLENYICSKLTSKYGHIYRTLARTSVATTLLVFAYILYKYYLFNLPPDY